MTSDGVYYFIPNRIKKGNQMIPFSTKFYEMKLKSEKAGF
jgi:hypothetical protein